MAGIGTILKSRALAVMFDWTSPVPMECVTAERFVALIWSFFISASTSFVGSIWTGGEPTKVWQSHAARRRGSSQPSQETRPALISHDSHASYTAAPHQESHHVRSIST